MDLIPKYAGLAGWNRLATAPAANTGTAGCHSNYVGVSLAADVRAERYGIKQRRHAIAFFLERR